MEEMSVSEKIKSLRKQRNMTQKQLAAQTGLAVITIQQYELTPERLAKARLDAEVRELIEKHKSGESLTDEEFT